ncbi:MAG: CAF17-like 4Fe-4S cluster assembly/insertion protein YgfZ [Actinomycetes bacterium]
MTGWRSPLLDRPGAVEAGPPDAGVAWHYGEPMREQRWLVAGQAMVDLSHRPVLLVSGADRLGWLHALTSQHLAELPPGQGTEALLLSPHGHVEHHLTLVDDGQAVLAHVEPGTVAGLLAFLGSMKFLLRVDVADVTDQWAVVRDVAAQADPDPMRRTVLGPCWRDRFIPRDQLGGLADSVAHLAGTWAAEAVRVAAHVPRLGFETDHRTIPHEVGWLDRAVHLDKGCYRGQETVARVVNLGRPPRRLVLLHLDGSDSSLPVHGDPVLLDGRPVGFVTSAVRHYELGPVAMALVKRSTPVDVALDVDGEPAGQEVVVAA